MVKTFTFLLIEEIERMILNDKTETNLTYQKK